MSFYAVHSVLRKVVMNSAKPGVMQARCKSKFPGAAAIAETCGASSHEADVQGCRSSMSRYLLNVHLTYRSSVSHCKTLDGSGRSIEADSSVQWKELAFLVASSCRN